MLQDWIEWAPRLSPGLLISLRLTGLCLLIGLPFGLLLAVIGESRFVPVRLISFLVVEVGRGAPALVLLYIMYFGLPEAGITLTAFVTAVISMVWTTGAYSSELFRAGLAAVPRGQREAALTSGLNGWTGFQHIVLPQAMRISVPPLASLAVTIFQASSLAFVIAVPELMSKAYELGSITFEYLSVFGLTAAMYAAVTLIVLGLVRLVERRLNRHV
ncbi:amino acid ABC transporter permease [Curtobacterium sp. MCSS17_005]|uniref:amino acid ABC transporter permease n=1 Tax=Curtobacterium sp. MCSS17_005 TaxID=2175641 RepID=UPI000DAACC25|nr:amino acid ABC transporter permease [Curtobacterium sp. MCSS17_005]WIB34396.1 amino acid ABC transporter permease [Curtobacterium sp. MCSS17_005]